MAGFVTDGQPWEPPESAANLGYAQLPVNTLQAFPELLKSGFFGDIVRRMRLGLTEAGANMAPVKAPPFPQRTPSLLSQPGFSSLPQQRFGASDRRDVAPPPQMPFAPFDPQTDLPPDPLLSAEEAQKMFAPQGVDLFNKPVKTSVAREMGAQAVERIRREAVLARWANATGWPEQLGATIGASILDPVNVAASFLPVIGEETFLANLGRLGFSTTALSSRVAARAAAGAVSVNLATSPLLGLQAVGARERSEDFGIREALREIMFNGVAGAVLHAGLGVASPRWRLGAPPAAVETAPPPGVTVREPAIPQPVAPGIAAEAAATADAPPATKRAALGAAVSQVMDGRPVDVGGILGDEEAFAAEEAKMRATAAAAAAIEKETPTEGRAATFTTARGSAYSAYDDGTTIRYKAPREEHPGEEGLQPRSEATVYVTPADANILGFVQGTYAHGEMSVQPLGDGQWGIKLTTGPNAGKFLAGHLVTPETEPAVGLLPVEVWNRGRSVHFGNTITDVRPAAPEAAAKVVPAAIPAAAAEAAPAPPATLKKPKAPVGLLRFLASKGGLREYRGELDAVGIAGGLKARIMRKNGMTLDHAREAAAEAGYMDHMFGTSKAAMEQSTVDDLLTLINQESHGEPVYSPQLDQDRIEGQQAYDQQQRSIADAEHAINDEIVSAGMTIDPPTKVLMERATRIYLAEGGGDPVDALERAALQLEAEEATAAQKAEISHAIPGWDDATTEAHAGGVPKGGGAGEETGSPGGIAEARGAGPGAPETAAERVNRPVAPQTPPDLARAQSELYNEGYSGGVPQDEFDAMNEAVYGPKVEPRDATPAEPPGQSPAREAGNARFAETDADIAAAEQRLAQSGAVLSPDEHAALEQARGDVATADARASAYEQAGNCLTESGV